MDILYIIPSIIAFILIILVLKQNQKIKQLNNLNEQKLKEIYNKDNDTLLNNINHLSEIYHTKNLELNQINQQINFQRNEIEESNRKLLKQHAEIAQYGDELRTKMRDSIQQEITQWEESAQEAASANAAILQEILDEDLQASRNKLASLQADIEDFRRKREVINQEILRSRALEEEQDFYRICLSDSDKADLATLNEVRARLTKVDGLNKLIYDNFVSKSVKEMVKRVLGGVDPSGIYKVTNIKTNEVYIGRSTAVASRWQGHCKAAFGLDGVADSIFQRALRKYGIDCFTWELLEKVPKDQLGTREKYWIEFYDTRRYGYNERAGG